MNTWCVWQYQLWRSPTYLQGRTGKLRIHAVLHTASHCDVVNDKGRIQLAVSNQSPIREPYRNEWISTEMQEHDVDECIRHHGSYATTNVFSECNLDIQVNGRAKGGVESSLRFRHNTLMHKTTAHKWRQIKDPAGRRQVIPFDRDIHFVPTEFLYSDPDMLRNYGERILIFNMHDPATREAFSTARENVNGYVLVSEPVSIDLIEGVFDLDKGTWENFTIQSVVLTKQKNME